MIRTLSLAVLGLLLTSASAQAQEYKTKFASRQDRKIVLSLSGSEVTVEGYDGDELIIKGGGYEAPPARAAGLRPVYNTGEDNTQLGLSVTTSGNTVRITKVSRKDANYVIRVPRKTALTYTQDGWTGGDFTARDLEGSLEVTMKNGQAKLLNVTGPVVASSVSGDITVRYATLRPDPSSISVVSGNVDVTLPASTKATLTARSISGELYTDFDLSVANKGNETLRQIGGSTVNGSINGGGTALSLKTVSGDVFVRKAK